MSTPRIGLALGGGAARGLAHIPMLEVFDELGLKPSIIAGSSFGALVGAAYASGVPAKEIGDHARQILANKVQAAKYLFGVKGARLGDLLTRRSFTSLQIDGEQLTSFVLPDGVALNVEDTQIPLRIVTTDFSERREHVIASGPLRQAVAASIAIPGLISAPTIDGRLYVDGGITNPVPFDHVREGSDITVAIDVTGRIREPRRGHHSNMELAVGSMLIMFHQIAMLRRQQNPPDIYITPPIEQYLANDFFRITEMIEAASKSKDELKRALETRIERIT
ncbi:patatin-like phospholipase family protein [Aestuariivirga sp. YIM B02566]|uniref:Patatin-like phospholipase family protein n=1 Tax=Taklimakanibacter albus TaxID=2800327 RepID=A0ACC5R9U3_9HYPH|nr:patatin-like phospholipase family protein [Aestuariivirga sp. YIM B02566]MBK1869446.1 patatin-like phospholipase family protein [Aestuariivirga sp. YIM B02566]